MVNIAAEQVFVAGLIKHPKKLLDYIDHLTVEDFKQSASRTTFEVIKSLVLTKDVETITKSKLIAEAKSLGHGNYLSLTKNGIWIDELLQESITENELDNHFLAVKRESLKENYKAAIEETSNYLDSTDDPLSLMISKVEDKIINQVHSLDRGDNVPVALNKDIWSFIEGLADDPGNLGLDVSFPVWQNRVGQIRNGGITFIASTAKCLHEDSRIYDSEYGFYRKIKDFNHGYLVASLDAKSITSGLCSEVFDNGTKELFEIKTALGFSIKATANHKLFTENIGWNELKWLQKGDYIALAGRLPEPIKPLNIFSEKEAYLIGALFGDGSLSQKDTRITIFNKDILRKVKSLCKYFNWNINKYKEGQYYISVGVKSLTVEAGIRCLSKKKIIDDKIYSLDNKRLANFLAGLWDTDGYIGLKHPKTFVEVSMCLASKEAVYNIRDLLLRFGIISKINYKLAKCNGKEFDSWRLTLLTRRSLNRFYKNIVPFMASKKGNKLGKFLNSKKKIYEKSNVDNISSQLIRDIFAEHLVKNNLSAHMFGLRFPQANRGRRTSKYSAAKLGKIIGCQELIDMANSDIVMDKIVSIKSIGKHKVYDLSIPNYNNYFADNILVHNCGKSQLALQMAYKAAVQGLPVLLLDSELNHNDQRIRLAGISAKVPYQFIETGFWRRSIEQLREHGVNDDATLAQIIECGKRLKDKDLRERIDGLPITYQSVSGMEVSQVIPHIRRWILQKVKPNKESKQAQCLIVYDYIKLATLQELKGSKNVAEWQMHGINMALLHDLMKKYNVPCVAFGQTNNEIDEGFKCVAGGKRISENATSISYLKKKTDDERSFDPSGTHFIKIFGGRYGAGTGDKQINFDVDLSCGDFKEIGLSTVNFNAERQKRIDEYKKNKKDDDHD